MAETPVTSAPLSGPEAAPERPIPERTVYGASGGRKTIFSFVFLILLPFFISIPAMIITRIQHGLMMDNWGFLVLALAFTALMFMVLVELIFSLRARVELQPDKVRMTLPAGRGPTPMLRYKTYEVPYDQVHSVETRREIYGGSLIPVQLKGARLMTKDGTTIPLGYVSEANVDPAFPFPAIAKQIADRARLPLIDRGNVRRSVRGKMFGVKADDAATEGSVVDDQQLDALNRSHRNFVLGLIGVLMVLIGIGIVDDLSEERLTDQAAFAEPAANTTPAKKETPPAKTQKKNP